MPEANKTSAATSFQLNIYRTACTRPAPTGACVPDGGVEDTTFYPIAGKGDCIGGCSALVTGTAVRPFASYEVSLLGSNPFGNSRQPTVLSDAFSTNASYPNTMSTPKLLKEETNSLDLQLITPDYDGGSVILYYELARRL